MEMSILGKNPVFMRVCELAQVSKLPVLFLLRCSCEQVLKAACFLAFFLTCSFSHFK